MSEQDFTAAQQQEVEKNWEVFSRKLPEILPQHRDMFALMRHGEIAQYHDTLENAYKTGLKFYEDGLFSIQEVTDVAEDMGYFSYVAHIG